MQHAVRKLLLNIEKPARARYSMIIRIDTQKPFQHDFREGEWPQLWYVVKLHLLFHRGVVYNIDIYQFLSM